MGFNLRFISILFLLLVHGLSAQPEMIPANELEPFTRLESGWKMILDDSPEYASTDFDDSKWLSFGPHLSLDAMMEQLRKYGGPIWYRYRFRISEKSDFSDLGLEVPANYSPCQVYLNGKLIFETRPFKEKLGSPAQVIVLPASFLNQKGAVNILAVRSANLDTQTEFKSPFRIGRIESLLPGLMLREFRVIALSSMLLILGAFFLVLFFYRRRERYYLYFSLMNFCLAFWFFAFSIIQLRFIESRSWQIFCIFGFSALTGPFLIKFTSSFLNLKSNFLDYFWIALFLGFTLTGTAEIFIAGALRFHVIYFIEYYYMALVLLMLYVIYRSVVALHLKRPFAGRILIGVSILFLAMVYSVLSFVNVVDSGQIIDEGFFCMSVFFATALAKRFTSTFDSLEKTRGDLTELNQNLEQKVSEQTSDLVQANENLRELDRLKTDFIANVTHEIRTPLTLVLGPLDTMLSNPALSLDESEKETLQLVRRNAARLLKLVGDLLDTAKLEARQMSLDPQTTDLRALLNTLCAHFDSLFKQKGLEFKLTGEPLLINLDLEKIEKAFLNILSNSIKFTESGGVYVDINRRGAEAEVIIRDTGIGVPEEARELIFERFSQADSGVNRKFGGTGIGLSVAAEIIRLHGGRIRVESNSGPGSSFIMTFPLEEGEANHVTRSERMDFYLDTIMGELEGDESSQGEAMGIPPLSDELLVSQEREILILEDNREMRSYLQRILGSMYELRFANNGREGLKALEQGLPDLILSDIMMPEMDGLTFLKHIRENKALRKIPAILLSARSEQEDRREGLAEGADHYITKPFDPRELKLRIRNLMEGLALKESVIREEKDKILTDLHDFVGGSLTDLSVVCSRVTPRLKEHPVLLRELNTSLEQAVLNYRNCLSGMEDLRVLADDFMFGLELMLLRRYSSHNRQFKFNGEKELTPFFDNYLNERSKKVIYTVAVEIATNDLKYGEDLSRWNLRKGFGPGAESGFLVELEMTAKSNYDSLNLEPGHGSENIRKRVEGIGGKIESKTVEGIYTIRIEIPCVQG